MIAILGAGAFGTALACVLARGGQDVALWSRSPKSPVFPLPEGVTPTQEMPAQAAVTLLVVPAQQTAAFLAEHRAALPDAPLVLCAKGIDRNSGELQTAIAARHAPDMQTAVLTGPGFASEIAKGLPTALTLACADEILGRGLQRQLSTDRMRLYLTSDVTGAQLGGALKNVVAIGAGIAIGAGLGESARAALMTRGFAEMRRLGVAMGGRDETFSGLSGLGDLALTCASPMSRNFARGLALGSGRGPASGKTVEGIATAEAACDLAEQHGIDMPLTRVIAAVLAGKTSVPEAMDALLSRPLKQE